MPEQLPNEEFAVIALLVSWDGFPLANKSLALFLPIMTPRQAADLIQEFCQSQGWQLKTENWIDQLKDYPV